MMTQKQMLSQALDFVANCFPARKAARASLVLAWLSGMKRHADGTRIDILASDNFYFDWKQIDTVPTRAPQIEATSSLINWLFHCELTGDDWRATEGDALVDELWEMINAPAQK